MVVDRAWARSWAMGLLTIVLGYAGCGGGGDDGACATGDERCACFGNGTCNDGLTCLSQKCVRLGGEGGRAGTGSGGVAGATDTPEGGVTGGGAPGETGGVGTASGGTAARGGSSGQGGGSAKGGNSATGGGSATGGS